MRACENLNRVAVLQGAMERCNASIQLGTLTPEPDFSMDGEREIEWCRSLRQLLDVTLRSEHEDFVLIQIDLEELEELLGSVRVLL